MTCISNRLIEVFVTVDYSLVPANFPEDVVKSLPEAVNRGIYFGWASVDNGPVYKMVMSIGWNPYYDNTEKSMETHIMHNFNRDLYGSVLKVCIAGYLRAEMNFNSLDALIEAIQNDIKQASEQLDKSEYKQYSDHPFFQNQE
ncbi:putative riboflavin kinase isoform X2 [Hermetia illucens]|uniref:putative riboflavin kinase isoform X2 n=1 Tax=Hermetia illucens TaxID=343691 RepID=UPI0018CC19B5|nr:putative riboflavin kinase isoform X2 [Hermetia illucens]